MSRTSIVRQLKVNDVVLSSVLQIGDIVEFKAQSKAFSVMREDSNFLGNEGELDAYDLFSVPIPEPVIYENVQMEIINHIDHITVADVHIIAISSSSLVQVGTNRSMDTESRIKHIRQLKNKS